MVEELAQRLRERSELTQDKWHSKDGYEEDIHSGYCPVAATVKKEITVFPTKLSPPPALLQSWEGAAATLLSGVEFSSHLLISYYWSGPQPELSRLREEQWVFMRICSLSSPSPRLDPFRIPAATNRNNNK